VSGAEGLGSGVVGTQGREGLGVPGPVGTGGNEGV
jgi:hypothetical protein